MSNYVRPKQYGWLQDLFLKDDIADSEKAKGNWASKFQSGSGIGGAIGGLLGTYGLPALISLIPGVGQLAGPALLAATAAGGALGTKLGGHAGGSMAAGGDMPDTGLGLQQSEDLRGTLEDSINMSAIKSGVSNIGTGMFMGADKFSKHIYDNPFTKGVTAVGEKGKQIGSNIKDFAFDKTYRGSVMKDLNVKNVLPGGKPLFGQSKYMGKLDNMDELRRMGESYSSLDSQIAPIKNAQKAIDAAEAANPYATFAKSDEYLWGEAGSMSDFYKSQIQSGAVNPRITQNQGNLPLMSSGQPQWDLQMADENLQYFQPEGWDTMDKAAQNQWTQEFRTWEDSLLNQLPESAYAAPYVAPQQVGPVVGQHNPLTSGYYYGSGTPTLQTGGGGMPQWDATLGKWSADPLTKVMNQGKMMPGQQWPVLGGGPI